MKKNCITFPKIPTLSGIYKVAAASIIMALMPFCTWGRTISGTVYAESDSSAVAGALCVIKEQGKQVAQGTTGQDGAFALEFGSDAEADLTVSLTGFNRTEVLIAKGKKNISLGPVFLSDAVALKEVTFEAAPIVSANGRTIVYPSAADVKASSTALSLFQKLPLPALSVNPINRSMSVDGTTPVILINGVPSSMDDFNTLQAKDIERVEYSMIAPVRYAAAGNKAFISITLKKRDDGGSFYGWAQSALTTGFLNSTINASYHQGPSQFSIRYNPSWRNYQDVYDHTTESYVADDFRVDIKHSDRDPFNYLDQPIYLKYVYQPSAKTLFSATFNAGIFTSKKRFIGTDEDSFYGDYTSFRRTSSKGFTPSLDLYLRHDFDSRNTLEAEVVGTLSNQDYRYLSQYTFNDGTVNEYISDVDGRRRSLITEVHYGHSFSNRTYFTAGFQNSVSHNRNTYLDNGFRPVLTDNNNYIYASLQQQVGKVFLNISTGMKMIWMKNDFNKRHFIRNLSSLQANWQINQKWNLGGQFSYQPGIPGLTSLTDYPQQTSPYLISNGNPDLKVSNYFRTMVYSSFNLQKFSVSARLAHYINRDLVANVLTYMGNRTFLSHSVNFHGTDATAAVLSMSLRDIHGFGFNLNAYYQYFNSKGDGWKHTLGSFSGDISLWWNKGPFTISYWHKLPGKNLFAQMVSKEENGNALSLEYKPDKHWVIGASVMYLFMKKGSQYPSWDYEASHPSYNERYIKDNANMFTLTVSYSADFGSIFRTSRRSLNNSDNGSSIRQL